MKKFFGVLFFVVVIGLLTGCSCQGVDEVSQTDVTSTGSTSNSTSTTDTTTDVILPEGWENLTEWEAETTLFVVGKTGFTVYSSLEIVTTMEIVGIEEISEFEMGEDVYDENRCVLYYPIRIVDGNGKVYYFIVEYSHNSVGYIDVYEDSRDGKWIYSGVWGYNPDGWTEDNIPWDEAP